jgi:hypothetical protein
MFYGVCHAQVFGVAVCSAGFVCSEPGYSVLAGNSSMRAGLLRGLSASLSDLEWLDHVQLVGAKRFCRSAVRSRCSLSPRPKIDVPTLIIHGGDEAGACDVPVPQSVVAAEREGAKSRNVSGSNGIQGPRRRKRCGWVSHRSQASRIAFPGPFSRHSQNPLWPAA